MNRVGSFDIGRPLGKGRTGEVFEARDARQPGPRSRAGAKRFPLALKRLQSSCIHHPQIIKGFSDEICITKSLEHPGICAVHAQGVTDDGIPYFVMDRVDGVSLRHLLSSHGALSIDEATLVAARVAEILTTVHGAHVVHRDIKPEHVVLSRSRKRLRVNLIDFGVAIRTNEKQMDRAHEQGRVFGTPSYASPEQALGRIDIDARADLFSLGILLFELIAGHVPFKSAHSRAVLERIAYEDAPRVGNFRAGVPKALEAIVAYSLARKRDDRIPTADTFVDLVHECGLNKSWQKAQTRLLRSIENIAFDTKHSSTSPATHSGCGDTVVAA